MRTFGGGWASFKPETLASSFYGAMTPGSQANTSSGLAPISAAQQLGQNPLVSSMLSQYFGENWQDQITQRHLSTTSQAQRPQVERSWDLTWSGINNAGGMSPAAMPTTPYDTGANPLWWAQGLASGAMSPQWQNFLLNSHLMRLGR